MFSAPCAVSAAAAAAVVAVVAVVPDVAWLVFGCLVDAALR